MTFDWDVVPATGVLEITALSTTVTGIAPQAESRDEISHILVAGSQRRSANLAGNVSVDIFNADRHQHALGYVAKTWIVRSPCHDLLVRISGRTYRSNKIRYVLLPIPQGLLWGFGLVCASHGGCSFGLVSQTATDRWISMMLLARTGRRTRGGAVFP